MQGNKNDKNDALAIAEAVWSSGDPCSCGEDCGTAESDDDTWSASANGTAQRTQKRNALRAHLSARGLTSRCGKSALYALIESVITPDEDGVIGTS